MRYNTISDLELRHKRVLIRVDMNVPINQGVITDDTRIKASLPTIRYALEKGSQVILMTHLGRPKEGEYSQQADVKPIAERLGTYLQRKVPVIDNWQQLKTSFPATNIVMLQNVRFNLGEKENSKELGQAYAALCDIFVNDAFGTAHRAQASTHAVACFAAQNACGLLLDMELRSLERALSNPQRPLLAIVGGSKISTKLKVLNRLADKVDYLIVGGGIANTFLLTQNINVGNSLVETSLINEAKEILDKVEKKGGNLPLPLDVYVAQNFSPEAQATLKNINELSLEDQILDFGPKSMQQIESFIQQASTIVWNGPVGVFEFPNFSYGTAQLAKAIAASRAYSVAGGGDTLAAINHFNIGSSIDYVSTGGGAFLEFLEGRDLPAIEVLLK
ncbi:MAG: phosphoglycerate kinase [Neisseriaceae bacterium]